MMRRARIVTALFCDESGASMAEYAIVTAALVLPLIAIFVAIETSAGSVLTTTGSNLTAIGQNV